MLTQVGASLAYLLYVRAAPDGGVVLRDDCIDIGVVLICAIVKLMWGLDIDRISGFVCLLAKDKNA